MKSFSVVLALSVVGCLTASRALCEDLKFPFEALSSKFALVKSYKIAEESFVPCYVKPQLEQDKLDPVKAHFRLLSPDGEERVLKCERIDDSKPLKDDPTAKVEKEDGFEYVFWLPKDAAKFEKGQIIQSTGFHLNIVIGRQFSGGINLGPKKDAPAPKPVGGP